jgi:tripartite-type tricarboxylate transporter receptor subunit TctC
MIVALPPTVPYIRQGRVRALGVASAKRAALTPDIPTLIEAGIAGMEFATWYGLFAPSAVPADTIVRLNASVNKALASPEFREQLSRQGIEPAGGTPEQFGKFFRSEVEKLGKVIRASGAKPE